MKSLASVGIEAALCLELELGIKEPYVRADGTVVDGVLAYPIDCVEGRRRYGYVNLPGVTVSPEHPVAWGPGEPRSVAWGQRGDLLVVHSPLDVFRVRASAARRGLEVAVVASSKPDVMPAEWNDAAFWGRWHRVVVTHDVPVEVRERIVRNARRPIETTAARWEAEWLEDDATRSLDAWLDGLLETTQPLASALLASMASEELGDFAVEPMPVHGGFCDGRLFYPFMVERRRARVAGERAGRTVHSYETLVVRSDGAVLEASTLPAPPGTPASQRVHALSDGTRVVALPEPSRNATWSLPSIRAFVAARASGTDPCVRSAVDVVADVHRTIGSRVFLTNPDDLWVATIFVVATHMFRVFRSFPILLVQGAHGTGKSELAAAVSALSFNAATMGQGSAAALVRLMRECGGLVVLDDAEGLGGTGAGFGDLAQCLKTGYRASTARKPITMPGGRVETFDFFGPRLVTCTRELEPVLASRCIRLASALGTPTMEPSDVDVTVLRDELHVLAMVQASDVAQSHADMTAAPSDREEEIWAPLHAVAAALNLHAAADALNHARLHKRRL